MPAAPPSTTDAAAPVRVLALIDHFVQGGAETLLARFALAAPRASIDLSIACLEERDGNPAAAPLIAAGIPPVNLNLVGRPGAHALRVVRAHLAQVRPQLVHTHLGTSDLLGGLAARSLSIPMVSTIHTTLWERGRERLMRVAVGLCADRIIAVSDSARREYLSHRGWAGREQVVTIHNGIDVPDPAGSGIAVRGELGFTPDDLVVAMASALRPEKGHELALQAMRILLPRFPNLKLMIVGQGQLGATLARSAEDLGRAVTMVGFKPDVMPYLDAADVCLQCSVREAFPTTLIEALAAGVPIVATAVGGIPEIVCGPELGVLIPAPPTPASIADALASLLEQPERRRAIAAAGRRAYRDRYTAEPWVRRTRAVYDDVIAERASGRVRPRRDARGLGGTSPVR